MHKYGCTKFGYALYDQAADTWSYVGSRLVANYAGRIRDFMFAEEQLDDKLVARPVFRLDTAEELLRCMMAAQHERSCQWWIDWEHDSSWEGILADFRDLQVKPYQPYADISTSQRTQVLPDEATNEQPGAGAEEEEPMPLRRHMTGEEELAGPRKVTKLNPARVWEETLSGIVGQPIPWATQVAEMGEMPIPGQVVLGEMYGKQQSIIKALQEIQPEMILQAVSLEDRAKAAKLMSKLVGVVVEYVPPTQQSEELARISHSLGLLATCLEVAPEMAFDELNDKQQALAKKHNIDDEGILAAMRTGMPIGEILNSSEERRLRVIAETNAATDELMRKRFPEIVVSADASPGHQQPSGSETAVSISVGISAQGEPPEASAVGESTSNFGGAQSYQESLVSDQSAQAPAQAVVQGSAPPSAVAFEGPPIQEEH
jgi:hypothetical protein